jgi:hypothetical protein
MTKIALSLAAIEQTTQLLRRVNAFITEQQAEHPLAAKLSDPPIPSELSESLAIHLLERGTVLPELKKYTFERARQHDILAYLPGKEPTLAIEVKASGSKGFQRLSSGDLVADYLIWISFLSYFKQVEGDSFTIYTLPQPGRFFQEKGYMSLQNFLKIAGREVLVTEIALAQLSSS